MKVTITELKKKPQSFRTVVTTPESVQRKTWRLIAQHYEQTDPNYATVLANALKRIDADNLHPLSRVQDRGLNVVHEESANLRGWKIAKQKQRTQFMKGE